MFKTNCPPRLERKEERLLSVPLSLLTKRVLSILIYPGQHLRIMNIACSQYKAQYEIVSVTCCVCYIINFDLFEGFPHASDSI